MEPPQEGDAVVGLAGPIGMASHAVGRGREAAGCRHVRGGAALGDIVAEGAGHRLVARIAVGGHIAREGAWCLIPAISVGPGLGVATAALGGSRSATLKAGAAGIAVTALAVGQVLLGLDPMEGRAGGRQPHRTQRVGGGCRPMAEGVVVAARGGARWGWNSGVPRWIGGSAREVALGADRGVGDIRGGVVGTRGVVPGLGRVGRRHAMAAGAGLAAAV